MLEQFLDRATKLTRIVGVPRPQHPGIEQKLDLRGPNLDLRDTKTSTSTRPISLCASRSRAAPWGANRVFKSCNDVGEPLPPPPVRDAASGDE